jgi:predicted regulator of Ras-like GTPase activity (Roadblock/LC7/MglB family)
VLVASPDGLPVESAGQEGDAEALAALTSALLKPAERLAAEAGGTSLARVVLEFEGGFALLGAVRGGNWLVVLVSATADVGEILFELRQQSPELAAQL